MGEKVQPRQQLQGPPFCCVPCTPKLGQFAGLLPSFGSLHFYYFADLIVTPLEKSFVGKVVRWGVKSAVVVRLWQSEIEIKVQCLSECFPLARGKQFAKRCFANISIACL